MLKANEIYLGSICIEKNRWMKTGKVPSIRLSEYLPRIADAGFDGIELWEDHYLKADAEERRKLAASPVPIKIVNTYGCGDPGAESTLAASLEVVHALKPDAIKFNFGRDFLHSEESIANTAEWLRQMPPGTRLLCELHGGFNVSYDDIFRAEETIRSLNLPIEAIVHPCTTQTDMLYRNFVHFGDKIVHMHMNKLRNRDLKFPGTLKILRRCGFQGSFTIEFTYGTGELIENTGYLFENAVLDLRVLRTLLNEE